MAIIIDHVANTVTVSDAAANANLGISAKGTGYVANLASTAASNTVLALPTAASDPSSPQSGWTYLNTTLNRFRHYVNSTWVSFIRLTGDTFSGPIKTTTRALTDAATVTPDLTNVGANAGNMFTLLATSGVGNTRTLALPTGLVAGEGINIQILYTQDATGGRALTFASGINIINGAINTNGSGVSLISLATFDGGTTWYGAII